MIQYPQTLQELKTKIRQARLKAAFATNAELIILYLQIGETILTQQENQE